MAVFVNLALIRPLWMKRVQGARGVPSRTEVLLGCEGMLTEDLDPEQGTGRLLIEGQDWAATSTTSLKSGDRVLVESADGLILKVSKIKNQ